MGYGDSNLVELSCCKLKKQNYVAYEMFIYTEQMPVRLDCHLFSLRLSDPGS